MHGNVWEWCSDTWQGNYEGTPTDGSASLSDNDSDAQFRVLRGGSWVNDAQTCRSAHRYGSRPVGRNSNVGFRVACSAT